MKKIRLYVISGFILFCFMNGICFASDIKEADKLFDKGVFQEALKQYETVFKNSSDSETRWKAYFRTCETLAHLFRYGQAAEKLRSIALPDQMPYQARLLILKAEIFRNFLRQYSSIQRDDVLADEEKDIFHLTPNEIKDEIQRAYIQLWELRNDLVTMDLRKEGYFINIKNVDFGMYPTLFDYLIFSWTDFLLTVGTSSNTEETTKPDAEPLLVKEY